jgi:squalene-hopene/tetraprenyl-beta-curcumene cyclase
VPAGIERLRGFLKEKYVSQSLFNRAWMLLASTRLNDLLTTAQREALITEIQSRQREDGGWSLEALGAWRWSKPAAPFGAPGTVDASLLAQSDGYATGLIVYTLRQAGVPVSHPAVSKGLQWLRANQHPVHVNEQAWPAWRAHSLNSDREHGGKKGEPWRRLFMSDSATAFAVLALLSSD